MRFAKAVLRNCTLYFSAAITIVNACKQNNKIKSIIPDTQERATVANKLPILFQLTLQIPVDEKKSQVRKK